MAPGSIRLTWTSAMCPPSAAQRHHYSQYAKQTQQTQGRRKGRTAFAARPLPGWLASALADDTLGQRSGLMVHHRAAHPRVGGEESRVLRCDDPGHIVLIWGAEATLARCVGSVRRGCGGGGRLRWPSR